MLAAAYPAGSGAADPVALAVLEEAAEYVGAALSDLINLFEPERILIGGRAGLQLGPLFLPAVREYAAAYALRHPAEHVSIDLGRLGPDTVRRRRDPPPRRFLRTGRTAGRPRLRAPAGARLTGSWPASARGRLGDLSNVVVQAV